MIYLDTSVVVPLLIAEPASEQVASWFDATSEVMSGSDWLVTEFASALAIKARLGAIPRSALREIGKAFDSLTGQGLRMLSIDRDAFRHAADLIEQAEHGLRAGDALHLAIAKRSGARAIATLDTRMAVSAQAIGLDVEPASAS